MRSTMIQPLFRVTASALLALLLPGLAAAANFDINLAACPGPQRIPVFVGDAAASAHTISVVGASGNVTWLYDSAPPTPTPCTNTSPVGYDCDGATITLPGSMPGESVGNGETVDIAGTPLVPSSAISATFTLEVADASDSCTADFTIVYPYDIVLVLDRSGSMGWDADPVGNPGVSRWTDLVSAVNQFTGILEAGLCAQDSRFGLTMFATQAFDTATANFMYNNAAFHHAMIDMDPSSNIPSSIVSTELAAQSPSGWTAMGAGLLDAIGDGAGNDKMNEPARRRVIMLFTDGEQNQTPLVSGTSVDGTPVHDGTGGPFELVAVGIGQPGPMYNMTLQDLADGIGASGDYIVTNLTADIGAAMTNATQSLLNGCSPQLVATFSGDLAGATPPPSFDVNRKVAQLLIQLGISGFGQGATAPVQPGITIERDGADVTEEFTFRSIGVGQAIAATDPTVGATEGEYSIVIPEIGSDIDFDFDIAVFADDERVDMDYGVTPASPVAEEPFEARMSLTWRGQPIAGADVQIIFLKPGDSIGDHLARADDVDLGSSDDPDAASPGMEKHLELLATDAEYLAALLPSEQTPPVTDLGDGSYVASFNPGDVDGVYQVVYNVRAEDAASFGVVERTASHSVYVTFPPTIDLASSETSVRVDGKTTILGIRPAWPSQSRPGQVRYVGPVAASGFSVTSPGNTLDQVVEHQNGSYELVLNGDPSADISVSLLDHEIYSGPAGDFGPPDEGLPSWLLWLLLLLLALIVVWLLRKVLA